MRVAIVNCFDTYEQRVDLLHDYFVSRGDVVRIYTSDYRHFEKKKRTEQKQDYIFIPSLHYKKNLSAERIVSHIKFSKDIFKRIEYQDIQLLWVLLPPNSLAKEASDYKKRHSEVKLVFDIIDMWPETMPIEKFKQLSVINFWRNLRDNNINSADYVVTECNLYQERLNKSVDYKKMSTIYMAHRPTKFTGKPNPSKDEISLCYLGSINNIIDIEKICGIIQNLKKRKPIVLHIIGDGENRDALIESSKKAGADVVYHGKIYDEKKKQKIFDSCHYGLNIMKPSVYVGLTMKSIDYFEGGLPIINNIRGDTWTLVENYGLGVNIDSLNNLSDQQLMRTNCRTFFEKQLGVDEFERRLDDINKKIYE